MCRMIVGSSHRSLHTDLAGPAQVLSVQPRTPVVFGTYQHPRLPQPAVRTRRAS
jgi:hypothetical protein